MFSPIIGIGINKGGKKKNDISKLIEKHVYNNAKEFFCGYNPPYWHNKFGFEVSPNGRFAEHEQINNFATLKEIVEKVHEHNIKIMGNINHWYYTDVVYNEFKRIVEDFLNVGIDGFIVSSMGVLEYLENLSDGVREKGYIINGKKLQLNISTIFSIYNIDAIKFLKENYPIYKVILSREVSLEEIENIIKNFPDLIFEVFGEGDFCRYNNGLCFAEHKYTNRDICTMVVNDLVFKKAIRYDFRKIINDLDIENNLKVKKFENKYKDNFELLSEYLQDYDLYGNNIETISQIVNKIVKNKIIFYDPFKGENQRHNRDFMFLYRSVKLLLEKKININIPYFKDLNAFINYLEDELNAGKLQYKENLKNFVGGKYGIQAKYKDDFYNRADNLNLYSYVFFDKFENIDTVKFPTRGRDYLPKIELIESCVNYQDKIFENLNMNSSFERAHYDLKYLFNKDKFWFYDIRQKIHKKYI